MKDAFSTYHPCVSFFYFLFVLIFTMFFMNPICLGISLACAFFYLLYLKEEKSVDFSLKFMLPMIIIAAIMNPLFNHQGETILTYFKNGYPLTLESVFFGVGAATMLCSIICWFSCYNEVITTDKFLYLFGRIIPSLSLILSMALRFVPRFKQQFVVVRDAQKCMGLKLSDKNIFRQAKKISKIFSIMVTWSMENAIETADSMKNRGYGALKRTTFSIYRFEKRDKTALVFILFSAVYIITGAFLGEFYYSYFPVLQKLQLNFYSASLYVCYFALCALPFFINIKEDRKWKVIQSKI